MSAPKTEFVELISLALKDGQSDGNAVGHLVLNRPDQANALTAPMMDEIVATLRWVSDKKPFRALIISGKGRHFCGGADLTWMQAAAGLTHEENVQDAAKLTALFEMLGGLAIPTIAVVRGSAFGGAVGLAAACDIVIASTTAKFCLSEAKLGLLPAVIAPYLGRRMHLAHLRRYALTARVFPASDGLSIGLVDVLAQEADLATALQQELELLLHCGPEAQKRIKTLFTQLQRSGWSQSEITQQAIAAARTSAEGQAGLNAFFKKTPAPWCAKLSKPFEML
jgi:methylglutaconyl-CoA hydratase